jgi:hypothetical protein
MQKGKCETLFMLKGMYVLINDETPNPLKLDGGKEKRSEDGIF